MNTAAVLSNLQASAVALVLTFIAGFVSGRLYNRIRPGVLDMTRSVAGVVMLLLAIVTTWRLSSTAAEYQRISECQAQDRNAAKAGLQARSEAANQAADAEIEHANRDLDYMAAQDRYIAEVTRPDTTAARRHELAEDYRQAIAAKAQADREKIRAQENGKQVRQDNPATTALDCDPPPRS